METFFLFWKDLLTVRQVQSLIIESNFSFQIMLEYSTLNISQSILPSDDKKYPLKENSTINWNRKMLMEYFESVRKMKGNWGSWGSQILPSSPETFKFQIPH